MADLKKVKGFMREYLERKGINTNTAFRCVSPNHEDKHPSMAFYDKADRCKCFACGESYDIYKLVGQEYGLKTFKEQLNKVLYFMKYPEKIENANKTIYSKKGTFVELQEKTNISLKTKKKHPAFDYYYYDCKQRMNETDYLIKRGISSKVLDQYNIGYDPKFKNGAWQAIIIPTSHYSFTARNIDSNSEDRLRKVGSNEPFGYWDLEHYKQEDFFIVEGEIDALSFIEAGEKSIALGTVTNINKLVGKLKEDMPKNQFFICLDNDEAGHKAQANLFQKMKDLGLKVIMLKLKDYKDPNEFLMNDRKGFIEKIEAAKDFVKKREKKREILRKTKEEELKKEDVVESLSHSSKEMQANKELEKEEKKLYKYYLPQRPVSLGTCPKNFIDFKNYDEKKYIEKIGVKVWGEVTYKKKLTEEQIENYELIGELEDREKIIKVGGIENTKKDWDKLIENENIYITTYSKLIEISKEKGKYKAKILYKKSNIEKRGYYHFYNKDSKAYLNDLLDKEIFPMFKNNNDKEEVLRKIKEVPLNEKHYYFHFVSDRLKNDKDVTIAALGKNLERGEEGYIGALRFASNEMKDNKEVMMEAVSIYGMALDDASDELKKDKELVILATKTFDQAIKYADETLQNDKEVVMEAVKSYGWALAYVKKDFTEDRDVVLTAVKNKGWALQLTPKFQNDKEIVMAALKNNEDALQFTGLTIQEEVKKIGGIDKWISKTEKELNNTKTKENPFAKKMESQDKGLGR